MSVLDAGEFSWIEHWRRFLLSLGLEPLMVSPAVSLVHKSFSPDPFAHPYLRLLNSVEEALRHRCPRAFFIEEAHHIFRPNREQMEDGALEILAAVARRTRTPHVLVGCYEMLLKVPVRAAITVIHFPRYRSKDRHEMEFFAAVVRTFAVRCPAATGRNLVSWTEYFYERTAGCIGILHGWLVRGLALIRELGVAL